MYVQVNLCPKLLLLHQLTHNMTTDCSLNYKFKSGENMLCTEIVPGIQKIFCTQHVLPHGLQKEELLTKIYLYILCLKITLSWS